MKEENLIKALNGILELLDNIDIDNEIDRMELKLNELYFLTHYEEQTKSKVYKKGTICKKERK